MDDDPDRFDSPHPYGEDLGKYEWHRVNTDSEIKECGSKHLHPNPIGLRDMLGNVEELTVNLFSPEYKQGRFGQLVIRGNSSKDSPGDFAVSHRTEFTSHRSTGKLRRPKRVGFRLTLSSAVSSSASRKKLNEECKRYMASDDRYAGSSTAALAKKNSKEQSKKDLNRFKSDIKKRDNEIFRLQDRQKQDQEKLAKKEQANIELRDSKKRLEAKVAELQKQLTANPKPAALYTLQKQLKEAQAEIRHLQEESKNLAQATKHTGSSQPSPGLGKFTFQELYTHSQDKVKDLEKRLAAAPTPKKLEEYEQQIALLQDRSKVLVAKLADLEMSKQQVKNQASTSEIRLAELSQELKSKKQRIADLERRQFGCEDKISENAKLARIAEKRYLEALMRQASANAYIGWRILKQRDIYLRRPNRNASDKKAQEAFAEASQMINDYWQLVVQMAEETQADMFPEVKRELAGWLKKEKGKTERVDSVRR